MGTRLLYFIDSAATGSSHGSLQVGGSAPATATTATEWIVNKNANPNYALMVYNNNVASWTTTAQPSTSPTTNDCFRTNTGGVANDGKLTGTFTSGNWTVSIPVIAVTSGGDQDGRMRVRIWRSANANGSSATEMTNGATQLSIVTNLAVGTAQTTSGSVPVTQNLTLSGEYIFVQLAWEITGAGGANGRDVLIRVGSTSSVTTTNFSETYTVTIDDTPSVTDDCIEAVSYVRSASDTAVVSDTVSVSREFTSLISDTAIVVSDTVDIEKIAAGITRTVDDTSIAVSDSVSISYPWDLAAWWRGYSGAVPWSGTSSYSASTSGTNSLSPYIPDPAKKPLLLWYRAPWDATSPWRTVGSLGNAPTAANDMITAGSSPTAGTSVNGYAALNFDGSTQALVSNGSAIDNLVPKTGFIIGVLFRADTAATADALSYNNPSLFSSPESLAFTYASFGGVASLSAAYYDGAWETVSTVAAATLGWHAAWLRYASGTLSIKLNGGNWTTVATGLSDRTVTPGGFGWYVGRTSISTTKWYDGQILELMTASSLTDTEIDEIHAYWNDRYTLSFPVGNNVPTAGVMEEPTKYGGTTLLLRAPYASGAQPFRSEPVKGVTWNRKDQDGANRPSQGTGANGFASASFDGVNDETTETPATGNMGNYISSTAWYIRVLCKTTSAPTNTGSYDADGCVAGESQGVLGLGIRNNGGTFQVRACHYDTGQRPTSYQNLTTGWHLIEGWFTGGTVFCSVDGATPVSAGAGAYGNVGSVVLTSGLPKLGRSWTSGNFWGGEILEVTFKNAIPTDDEREMYRARYLKDRYNLTIGSQLPTRYPVSGTALHGYGTADFQGNDILEGESLSEYWSTNAGSGWALVNIDSCSSNDSPTAIASGQPTNTNLELNPFLIMSTAAPSTNTCDWGVYVRNNSGTLVFGFRQWTTDGFTNYEYYVESSLASGIGKWALVQWRYGSSQIAIRINNGSWTTASATVDLSNAGSLVGKVYLGRSQAATPEYIDGRVVDLALSKTRLNDDTFTDVYSYVQERYFSYATGADDTIAVSDSVQADKIVPAGTTYTPTISTDTPSVTDSATVQVDRSPSETITVSDTTTRSIEFGRVISDSAAVVDSATITAERSPAETVTVTETSTCNAEYGRSATDTAIVSDSVANTVERSPSDSVSVTEQVATALAYQSTISESVTVADSAVITVERSPADSVTTSDSPTTSLSYLRQVTEAVSVSDSLAPEVQKTVTDTIAISDSVTVTLLRELTGQANDTISVTDTQALEVFYVRAASDTAVITDSIGPQPERSPAESITVTETLTSTVDYSRALLDSATVTDSVAITTERSLSDSILVTETVTKEANSQRTASDSAAVADQTAPEAGRSPADTATVTDTQILSTVYHRLPTETATVSDSTAVTVERSPSDSILVSDNVNASLEYAKLLSDSAVVADLLAPEVGKSPTDTATVTETVTLTSFFGRTSSDTCAVTDVALVTCERSTSDNISVSDSVAITVPYVRDISDTATVTDTKFWELDKSIATDSVALSETVTKEANSARTGSDSATVADATSLTVERSPAETLTVTETLTRAVDYRRTLSEDLDVLDSVIADLGAGFFASQDDSVTVSDQVTASTSYVRSATDTAIVTDQASWEAGKTASDNVSAADTIARTATASRDLADTVAVTEATSITVEIARTDAVAATDSTSIEVSKTLSDSTSVSDTTYRSVEVSPTDSVTVADAKAITVERSPSDSISVTYQLQTTTQYVRSTSEAVVVDDLFIIEFGAVLDRFASDSIALSETLATEASYARPIVDTATASDYISLTNERALSDSIAVLESVTAALERAVTVQVSDTPSVTDALTLEVSKSLGDAITTVDSGTAQTVYAKTLADTTSVADSVSWEVGKTASDAVSVLDSVDVDFRSFAEVAVSDTVDIGDFVYIAIELSPSDSLVAQDTLSTSLSYNRLLAEAATLQDQASVTAERSPADALSLSELLTLEKAFSRALAADALSTVDSVLIEKSGDIRIELDDDEISTVDTLNTYAEYLLRLATDALSPTDEVEAARALHLAVSMATSSGISADASSAAQLPAVSRAEPPYVPDSFVYIVVPPPSPTPPGTLFRILGVTNPYSAIESLLLFRQIKSDVIRLITGVTVYRLRKSEMWRLDSDKQSAFVRHGPKTLYRVQEADPTVDVASLYSWKPVY